VVVAAGAVAGAAAGVVAGAGVIVLVSGQRLSIV
jgi:hypothetical protein